jgi:hypothetical protein
MASDDSHLFEDIDSLPVEEEKTNLTQSEIVSEEFNRQNNPIAFFNNSMLYPNRII